MATLSDQIVADAVARAQKLGVSPYRAVGIMTREGLNPNTIGNPTFGNPDARGYSYGPWQLFSGSPRAGAVAPGGMAAEFQQRYGAAPSAANWREQNQFALERLAKLGDKASNTWYSVRDAGGWGNIENIGRNFLAKHPVAGMLDRPMSAPAVQGADVKPPMPLQGTAPAETSGGSSGAPAGETAPAVQPPAMQPSDQPGATPVGGQPGKMNPMQMMAMMRLLTGGQEQAQPDTSQQEWLARLRQRHMAAAGLLGRSA